MRWWAALPGLILPVLVSAQQILLATGPTAGLADNQSDCSFQGSVRSIRIEHSEIEEDGHEGQRELTAKFIFDRNGREREYWRFYDQGQYGKVITRYVFLYDPQGRVIETDTFDMKEDARRPQRLLTKYDSEGREWETRSLDTDGSIDNRTVREYDARGDAVKETAYGFEGKISSVEIRQYDTAHHVIRQEIRNMIPESVSTKIFRYNEKGQRLETFLDWEDGPAHYVYEYDEHGRLSSVETISGPIPAHMGNGYGFCDDCGVFPGKTTFRHDNRGLLTEERVIQPGNKLIRLSEYAYDARGHHVREWVYSTNPSGGHPSEIKLRVGDEDLLFDRTNGLRSTSYTYDSRGNWIKAVVTRLSSDRDLNSNRIIDSVTYRIIKYR